MNSFPSEVFANFPTINAYEYELLTHEAIISGLFELDSPQKPNIILTFSNKYLLIERRLENGPSLFYRFEVNKGLSYRINSVENANYDQVPWSLYFSYNSFHFTLKATKMNSAKLWDDLLRKSVVKLGFHDEFKPIRRIGCGASATVFEVIRKKDSKKFAVKAFIKENINKQPRLKLALDNEIKILRILSEESHQNILNLHYIYESQNSIYLVMDLCTGGILSNRLSQGIENMSEANKKLIMTQLLRGLAHIHSKNIAHRDIKLENILIQSKSSQTQLIIGDFGLSTQIQQCDYLFTACGTPGFVAPQVINAKKHEKLNNPTCDIFSAGIIFHFLLTGRPLFEGRSLGEVLQNNKKVNFDLNQERYNTLDQKALNLLKGMLEIDPNCRISAQKALMHSYFIQQSSSLKLLSPAPTFMTNNYQHSALQFQQIKLEGLHRQKQSYRKASQQ